LLGELLRGEDVHRHRQLLGRGVPRAGAHHHVDRRELDGRRVKARLIDGVLVGLPAYWIALALTHAEARIVTVGISLALSLTYFFLCEALTGQTIGKRFQHLRVMRADYRPAAAKQIAARTVLRALEEPFLALIAMFASRERRQRIGDLAGGTIVARADECLERPPPSPLLVVYPLLWLGGVLLFAALLPTPSSADRDRAAFEAGLQGSLAAQSVPAPVTDCIVERSRTEISDADLLRIGASVPYMMSSGMGALPRPLRSRIFEMTFQCIRRTGYLDQTSLPSDPGQRKQYVKCITRHAQPVGLQSCMGRYGVRPG
jgi:uncharacterized RDD family membrane protein YckC